MDVVLVRWPEEAKRLIEARANGTARLLLVGRDVDPPVVFDPLEDWVRVPADDRDVRARLATLATRTGGTGAAGRATSHNGSPYLDQDGLLHVGGQWVALSPVESALAECLLENIGAVVSRGDLARAAWPIGAPTRNALDVHILRLRRRLDEVGLRIVTVRSRGYVLEGIKLHAIAS